MRGCNQNSTDCEYNKVRESLGASIKCNHYFFIFIFFLKPFMSFFDKQIKFCSFFEYRVLKLFGKY